MAQSLPSQNQNPIKMKKVLAVLFIATTFLMPELSAQETKVKKGIGYVDGRECLKVIGEATNVTYSSLAGDELIILKYLEYRGDRYTEIIFLNEEFSFTCTSYGFTKKLLFKKLVEHGVIADCKLDAEKARNFALKYHENIW